jgi:phosphatidate phosphatase APP1
MRRTILVAILALPAAAEERDAARILAFDAVTPPGRAVTLSVKIERDNLTHRDLERVPLLFARGKDAALRATTGDDGIATVSWTPPAARPDAYEFTVSLAPDAKCAAPDATLRVFVRDPKRPVLVVDLDGTVCAASALEVATKEPGDLPALEGSAEALHALSKRYDILYLTARDDGLFARSRAWLDLRGFPAAPVLVRDLKVTTLSAERFKKGRLVELKRDYNLVAGVGDRDEDGDAYLAAGMKAVLVGPGSTPEGAVRFDDWKKVRAELEK